MFLECKRGVRRNVWVERSDLLLTDLDSEEEVKLNELLSCFETKFSFVKNTLHTWKLGGVCNIGGKSVNFGDSLDSFIYEDIYSDGSMVIIKPKNSVRAVRVFHIVGENSMWEYYPGESIKAMHHRRHYYRVSDKKLVKHLLDEMNDIKEQTNLNPTMRALKTGGYRLSGMDTKPEEFRAPGWLVAETIILSLSQACFCGKVR